MNSIYFVAYLQATRHARRVYVGGLPPLANEQVLVQLYILLVLVLTQRNTSSCFSVFQFG